MVLIYSSASMAQDSINWRKMGNNKGVSFYEIQNDFKNYWKDKTPSRSRGYKPFKRWESYMSERVYPSGNMNLPSSAYTNYIEWQKRNNSSRQATNNLITSNWTEVGPIGSPTGPSPYTRTGAGRTTFIRFSPDLATMYVGTPDGGLWKSTNNGASWTTNTDFLGVIGCSDIAITPSNPNVMYLATGDIESDRKSIGILKSIDGGNTWNPTSLTFTVQEGYKISKLLMDPSNSQKMIVATNTGIFYTTDGWQTNTFVSVNGEYPTLYDMEFKPGNANANTVYAAGTKLYKSTDFGATWVQITNGIPTTDIIRIALGVSPNNDNYVYALIAKANSSFKGVYRSSDSGSSFSTMSTTPNLLGYAEDGNDTAGQGFYDLAIAVSPVDANYLVVGGINHWISSNGGSTWINTSVWDSGEVHADVHDVYYLPNSGTTVFSCNDGGIFKSTDNGDQWTDISSNLAIGQVVGLGLSQTNSDFIVAGQQDNGTNLKTVSSWTNINGGDGGECFTDYTDNNTIYVQYVEGKYSRSDDGGTNVSPIQTGLPTGMDFYSPFKIDPNNHLKIYSGGTPVLYTSNNKGNLWSPLGSSAGTGNIKDFVVAPSNSAIIYTVQEDAISKSTNSGTSFSNITTGLPTNASFKSITVSNTNPNKIWVTYSGFIATSKVFKSIDGGLTWTNISSGLPNLPINTVVYRDNSPQDEVYIGADIGIFTMSNATSTWTTFMTGLPNVAVRDLEIYYPTNKLRAGTYGRGIWESNLSNAGSSTSWTGAVSTDWNNTGNWSNGIPNSTLEAIINYPSSGSNLPVISNNATANKITLNSTTTLLVTATNSLTVTNEIVNDGILTLENNSNLIQINNSTNTGSGNTIVNRNSSLIKRQDYTMWSSPVNGAQTLKNFSPLTVTSPIRFNSYNPATLPDGYFEPLTNTLINSPFEIGKGYLIRVADNHPTVATVWNGVFNGLPNNGTISASITPNQSGISGFNAIGNPYPSDLDLPLFFAENTNLTGTAYFWRKTNGAANGYGYCTWASGVWTTNTSNALAPTNDKISPGQAFIVQASSGTSVTFKNTMRTIENTDNFYRSNNSNTINGMWLNLNDNNSNFSQNAIVYADGSTNGYDHGKDAKLLREQDFSIYSIFDNNNYTIQSRSVPLISSEIIPIGIKTQTDGNYSISIDHISGFFSSAQDIYIKDLLNNTIQSLSNPYTFFTTSGSIDNRFQIMYASALNTDSNILNQNDIIVFGTENGIKINSEKIEIEKIRIYDYTGRLLIERNNVKNKSITIDTSIYKNLLGLIQINTTDNKIIYKKIKL